MRDIVHELHGDGHVRAQHASGLVGQSASQRLAVGARQGHDPPEHASVDELGQLPLEGILEFVLEQQFNRPRDQAPPVGQVDPVVNLPLQPLEDRQRPPAGTGLVGERPEVAGAVVQQDRRPVDEVRDDDLPALPGRQRPPLLVDHTHGAPVDVQVKALPSLALEADLARLDHLIGRVDRDAEAGLGQFPPVVRQHVAPVHPHARRDDLDVAIGGVAEELIRVGSVGEHDAGLEVVDELRRFLEGLLRGQVVSLRQTARHEEAFVPEAA